MVGDLMWPANASFCCERANADANEASFHRPLGGSRHRQADAECLRAGDTLRNSTMTKVVPDSPMLPAPLPLPG